MCQVPEAQKYRCQGCLWVAQSPGDRQTNKGGPARGVNGR